MPEFKDVTEVIGAGNLSCSVWMAAVGTAFPANMSAAFSSNTAWDNLGFLKNPPNPARAISRSDLEVWNADEPLASILDSDVSTVVLNPTQCNRLVFELYFGKLVYSTITGGVHIEPDPAGGSVEKAFCLELVDGIVGGKVLRVGWRRCVVSETGAFNMDKADSVSFEMTLKRLVPAGGSTFFIDTNIAGLISV